MGWMIEALEKAVTSFFIEVSSVILSILAEIMNLITLNAIDSLKFFPSTWNADLYTLVKTVHSKLIVPIALLIFSFMLAKEIIEKLIDNNSFQKVQPEYFITLGIRIVVTLVLITKSFQIIETILYLGKIFLNSTEFKKEKIDFTIANIDTWKKQLKDNLTIGTSFIFMMASGICGFLSIGKIVKMLIAVFKRMFDMYYILAFGSIPFAMIMSEKTEHETWNFIRRIFAVCLQVAFFLLLIRILDIVWQQFVLVDFKNVEAKYTAIIVSLLKMLAYISCVSIGFDKVEELSERVLGLR